MNKELPLFNDAERQPSSQPGASRQPTPSSADSPEALPQAGAAATVPRRRRRGRARRRFTVATMELAFV